MNEDNRRFTMIPGNELTPEKIVQFFEFIVGRAATPEERAEIEESFKKVRDNGQGKDRG